MVRNGKNVCSVLFHCFLSYTTERQVTITELHLQKCIASLYIIGCCVHAQADQWGFDLVPNEFVKCSLIVLPQLSVTVIVITVYVKKEVLGRVAFFTGLINTQEVCMLAWNDHTNNGFSHKKLPIRNEQLSWYYGAVHYMHAGGMVGSIAWNDSTNMLAAVTDGRLAVWYHPLVAFTNKDLLPQTLVRQEDRSV